MEITNQVTIGEMVANDYRVATVFDSFGIDFCCKGQQTLEEVCEDKKIDVSSISEALEKSLANQSSNRMDFNFWPLNQLADYIEKKHHRFIEDRTPLLQHYLNKLCKAHGGVHRELFEVADLFSRTARELSAHMKKEELILFPYIRKMLKKFKDGTFVADAPYFRSLRNPIMVMMREHENEGDRFGRIAALTQNYTPPADACDTYRVTYTLLEEFAHDLHRHLHLENNILFPRAIQHEEKMQAVAAK